jgi:hypothetical protein
LQDSFDLYHQRQESHEPATGAALPALGHAIAGSTGTAISNLCIYPLDLIVTRLQVQRQLRASSSTPDEGEYKGVLDAASQIYNKEGGIRAFYTGVLQDTGKSIADAFIFFLFYNYLRANRLQKHGSKSTTLPVLDELAVGALAGACSKFFTTPISNIVTRKQTASMISARSSTSSTPEPSVSEIVSQIRSEKGLQGFWSGYSASLVLTLNPSLTFFLYETFKRTLLAPENRDDPKARVTFLMAAVSKAIASTITYPFSLAKSRAQAGGKAPINPNDVENIKEKALEAQDEKNKDKAKAARHKIKAVAKRSTVFSAISKIYQEDGLAALYEGLLGEILKGFFSHGTTMLVKEAVHKVIIKLYFVILKALNNLPTTSEVVCQAKDIAGQASGAASAAYEKVEATAEDAIGNVGEQTGEAVRGARAGAEEVLERTKKIGGIATEIARTEGSRAEESLGELMSDVRERAEKGADYMRKFVVVRSGEGGK